jgi:hypothetical protein
MELNHADSATTAATKEFICCNIFCPHNCAAVNKSCNGQIKRGKRKSFELGSKLFHLIARKLTWIFAHFPPEHSRCFCARHEGLPPHDGFVHRAGLPFPNPQQRG